MDDKPLKQLTDDKEDEYLQLPWARIVKSPIDKHSLEEC